MSNQTHELTFTHTDTKIKANIDFFKVIYRFRCFFFFIFTKFKFEDTEEEIINYRMEEKK